MDRSGGYGRPFMQVSGRLKVEAAVPFMDLDWVGNNKLLSCLIDGRKCIADQQENIHTIRPELRQDYPLNLSISISGGKETNQDSLSNGE